MLVYAPPRLEREPERASEECARQDATQTPHGWLLRDSFSGGRVPRAGELEVVCDQEPCDADDTQDQPARISRQPDGARAPLGSCRPLQLGPDKWPLVYAACDNDVCSRDRHIQDTPGRRQSCSSIPFPEGARNGPYPNIQAQRLIFIDNVQAAPNTKLDVEKPWILVPQSPRIPGPDRQAEGLYRRLT